MSSSRRAVLAASASPILAALLPGRFPAPAAIAAPVVHPERLDYTPFLDAIVAISDERHAELDGLLVEATASEMQGLLATRTLTSREVVLSLLRRIGILDRHFNAVIALNPGLLTHAERLDTERANGAERGPFHGIPVLLKDNIGTGDRMTTTAGAAALADARCDRDAFLVRRLRDAGAIILGKANLSEWAGWMASEGPFGYSAIGGQAVNPYGDWLNPLGSSVGSAVAVAASYVPLTLGTETRGSIISPAAANSVVGMHPSLGLISRDRVVPLFDQMDTPGPLTRTVADSAALLTVLASQYDSTDSLSRDARSLIGVDFRQSLRPDALKDLRIGLLLPYSVATADVERALQPLFEAGATLEDIELAGFDFEPVDDLLTAGFRIGVKTYLTATANKNIRSVDDIVAFNDRDPNQFAPFGQDLLLASAASRLRPQDVIDSMDEIRADMRAYLRSIVDGQRLDLIVSVNAELAGEYGVAGFPAMTVPAGYLEDTGAPFGLTFVGDYLADETVIAAAYAYEQASQFRRPPKLP